MGYLLFLFCVECHGACRFALLECLLEAEQHLVGLLGRLVASGLGLFLYFLYAAVDGLEVFELQLHVDYLFVAHRVHRAIDVCHIVVVEAAQHVYDGISLAYVGEELVSQPFALACALDKSGDVHYLDGRRDYPPRMYQLCQLGEALVGHGDDAHIGLDGAEWEVCRLCLGV